MSYYAPNVIDRITLFLSIAIVLIGMADVIVQSVEKNIWNTIKELIQREGGVLKVSEKKIIIWLLSIFLMMTLAAVWLNHNPGHANCGSQNFAAEYCE